VQTIGGVTVNELRFDPMWDPLRNHPRFEKLLTYQETPATR
jgi:hypothetical protein